MSQLKAEKLYKSFKGRSVVAGVDFHIKSNEVVGLLGPNGAGKTTSFYMMVGLLFPDQGEVYLDDRCITNEPLHKRSAFGVSYLPQSVSIFRKMTVAENLLAIMEIAKIKRHQRTQDLEELLEKFQIGHIRNSLGMTLSGGERRRVEIARSLIIKPRFLLLDEPFAGVDPVTVEEIQKIIHQLSLDGLGVLITDHNVREMLGSCQRAYVLSEGRLIAEGKPATIAQDPIVRQRYLGENFRL